MRPVRTRRRPHLAVVLAVLALLTGCSGAGAPAAQGPTWEPPPAGADWDYQLGGPAEPDPRVGIVVRDRTARPSGRYDVCSVNAFQTQPDERASWEGSARRWALVLKRAGKPVVDQAWGEWLLDIRSASQRRELAGIVGGWLEECAVAGYDAVELDNLDSFSRSEGLLTAEHALAYARLLVARAHRAGLAVAQKNGPELAGRGRRLGFDFALAEECGRWGECGAYAAAYGRRVLVVEYRRADFDLACRADLELPVVLRDRALTPDGVREWC